MARETNGQKLLLNEREVASEYGLSVPWLRRQRLFKTGPVYLKVGRNVLYRRTAIEEFLNNCEVKTAA